MTKPPLAYAIVLAAGYSQRMGQDKAALPWLNGQPLGQWLLETLATTGWIPRIVLGPHNWDWGKRTLPQDYLVFNPDPSQGKTTSIAAGVQAVPQQTRAILISAIDQPRQPQLYARLRCASVAQGDRLLVPTLNGRWDHPLVFVGAWRHQLLHLRESQAGLRQLLHQSRSKIEPIPGRAEWGLGWDANTPDTYSQIVQFFTKH
ncbi:NTP transferase domain-containing protein [Candidatus Synechococcus calcipolaris G9]|uniref:NTP transferase domain-containing protein n=1 Tax=Candidatus Synechococcus calcipolaris G9 TaxID=1497997 RepID=A0ABT6F3G5_9SYNE|nr:NTP transferase domain-containing protein [Candidatus Synechococcus calcipolaris]MDG2992395.1 NTP transferase domain-containing protein [Candidatus Synechococcus calcipolaris G9]